MYTPEGAPQEGSVQELTSYVSRELESIALAFATLLPRELEELHAEPEKLKEFLIVAADGTDWDPGSGQGVYAYYAGTWHKLG